jgi:digeranylgeranylglycerophospholipid reductase
MEEFDVAVIGGGPAGTSAAYHSAKLGLKTALFEEHQTIGEPVHCGECLSSMALTRVGLDLPAHTIAAEVDGVAVVFPNGSRKLVREKGYVLHKHKFEQFIAALAADSGATVKLDCMVRDLKRNNDSWTLETKQGQFSSKIVIDASGPNALSSRRLGLNKPFSLINGLQYELEDVPQEGYLDFYLWPRLAPHGYLWMIPKEGGNANVGLVTTEPAKTKPYLDQFVKELGWEAKKRVRIFGGSIPCSGPVEKTYSDGLMLIGDAAGFTSPLFEGGTQLSLVSGRMASDVAKEALAANDTSARKLSKYEKLWQAEFPVYEKIIGGKDALYNLTDSELNEMAEILPDDISHINPLAKLGIGAKVLFGKRHLWHKGFAGIMASFGYSRAKYYGW